MLWRVFSTVVMDNDEDRQNVNHINYAGVGLPGTMVPAASSRTSAHGSNVAVISADGNLPPAAVPYRWKGKVPQYPAEHKLLNGFNLQNGSVLSLERQSESGVYLNHTSLRQGQFNSLPSRAVSNSGPYYNGTHTKSTSSAGLYYFLFVFIILINEFWGLYLVMGLFYCSSVYFSYWFWEIMVMRKILCKETAVSLVEIKDNETCHIAKLTCWVMKGTITRANIKGLSLLPLDYS